MEGRKWFFIAMFCSVGIIFLLRLFYIQVVDDSYKLSAENNVLRKIRLYPARGEILDRNGKMMVSNQIAYDIMVVPNQINDLDTALFCELVKAEPALVRKRLREAKEYSTYKPSVVLKQVSKEQYAALQEMMFRFAGFYGQKRTLRRYENVGAANVVGFIGEVTDRYLLDHPEYEKGDLIGVGGLEKAYEKELRGKKGVRYILVDVHNREKGSFQNGQYDTVAKPGATLESTIDIDLQLYGEQLMAGKRGSVVAIDPRTGEILTLVTSPGYDPNLLVGRERSRNYSALYRDSISKPLFDRGLLAEYPPGSPFKLVNALIGLQEGVIDVNSTFTCHHGFHYGRLHVACHCETNYPIALEIGISKSCNNYFCNVFKRIIEKYPTSQEGMDRWSAHVKSFGLGKFLNNDLPTGRKGFVPTAEYYNRSFGYPNWKAVSTISLAIGQGELLVTPIQLANLGAVIANKGHYFTPHIVRKVGGEELVDTNFTKPKYTTIDEVHFDPVIEAMHKVFEEGTARGSRIESIPMCGKTGTAENPHGQDHSIFIAFAPKDNPRIAMAIIVENGYWGSRWAAPIASLMMEKYLTGEITRPELEKRMVEGSLDAEYAKQYQERFGKPLNP